MTVNARRPKRAYQMGHKKRNAQTKLSMAFSIFRHEWTLARLGICHHQE